jgi:hypothetical protein
LAIIVKDWIDQNQHISGEKPEKILEQIIGRKHYCEDSDEDSDDEERKRAKS